LIAEQGITVWYSVPSALVYLLLHGDLAARDLDRLRLVLFAGEVFPMKYLRQLADLLPHAELYNLYGPTETNVCTYHRVDRFRLAGQERLPIGAPAPTPRCWPSDETDSRWSGAPPASCSCAARRSRPATGAIPTRRRARWCRTRSPPTWASGSTGPATWSRSTSTVSICSSAGATAR
jgi:acyl-CoA synthetase (AMP-forming)/AMP-acid ligase II